MDTKKVKESAKALLLNEQVRKQAPTDYNSTAVIRKFRNTRYGPKSTN